MKCKACGSELITGTKKCPYCGALNNIVVKKNNDAFDWSQSDFHKQSKRKKMFRSTGMREEYLITSRGRCTTRRSASGKSLKA